MKWSAGIRQFVFIIRKNSVFHCFFLLPPHFLFLSACNLRSDVTIFDAHDRVCNDHRKMTTQRRGNVETLEEKAESGVVMDLHYSLNWVIQDNYPTWDCVSTDT